MPTVAYLANQFPSPVEPYVFDEIRELRRRGLAVVPCSARRPDDAVFERVRPEQTLKSLASETLYLQPLHLGLLIRAVWLSFVDVRPWPTFAGVFWPRGANPARDGCALCCIPSWAPATP